MKQNLQKTIALLLCLLMLPVTLLSTPVEAEAQPPSIVETEELLDVVGTLFTGEKTAAAWSTALTVNAPDTTLFHAETMVRIRWDGNAAPALVFSSWSGGATWAAVQPSANVGGDLLYSYADMEASFGTDFSLVNSISVMAQNTAITVYRVDVVTVASVERADTNTGGTKRVVGYLPDWSYTAYRDFYDALDFGLLTHINIAFCRPDANGVLSCGIPDADLRALVARAHEHNVKVLLSLGEASAGSHYTALTAAPDTMQTFNQHILEYCTAYQLDGIDLDIESTVEESFWTTYEDWCVSLRALCDANGLLLSTATAGWLSNYASKTALDCFDYLNIMAYDNDTSATSHSDYAFALASLQYFHVQRGIAKDKLVLGVPFYGRGYNEDGTLSWTSYVSFSDLVAADPANYDKDLYQDIAYNGATTMTQKCELAKDYGGVMIWELTQDASGEQSLLLLIGNAMLKEQPIIGDVNLDGTCSIADAILLQRNLLGTTLLTTAQAAQADLQTDGVLNALDLLLLKRLLLYGTGA